MRTHVIIQQTLLERIESGGGVLGNLLKTNPGQDGTADRVTLNTRQATLATLHGSYLLGFAMKRLDRPAQGTHRWRVRSGDLSPVVGGDIVRALGRAHRGPRG